MATEKTFGFKRFQIPSDATQPIIELADKKRRIVIAQYHRGQLVLRGTTAAGKKFCLSSMAGACTY